MDFRPSEEQLAVQDMTRRFARETLLPGILEREEQFAEAVKARQELFEMGFGALLLPEEDGGMGLDTQCFVLALQELAAVDAALALQLAHHNVFGVMLLREMAGPDLRDAWMEQLSAGQLLAVWAGTEDQEDPLALRQEKDGLVLEGGLRWVTGGASAGLVMVGMRREEGSRLLLLPGDTPGLTRLAEDRSLGLRCAGISRFKLKDVNLASQHELAFEEQLPAAVRQLAAIAWGAVSLGMMIGAAELSRTYAAERVQFGRSIDSFEAIRFKLAEMALRIESLTGLLVRAAAARDAGMDAESGRLADMAQLAGAIGASYCGRECVQIHGGYGYSREYHAERFMRDSRAMELVGGGAESLRERLATTWMNA